MSDTDPILVLYRKNPMSHLSRMKNPRFNCLRT